MLQQNGCDVVVFVQSKPSEIIKNIYHRHKLTPPYPIIPDKEKKFYKLYHVQSSKKVFFTGQVKTLPFWLTSVGKHGFKQGKLKGDLFLVPAMFLVDSKNQKIIAAKYGSSFYDNETFTSIYESLTFDVET